MHKTMLNCLRALCVIFFAAAVSGSAFAYPPLHQAVYDNDLAAVKRLIAGGADVNQTDSRTGYAPLHTAALHAEDEVIKLLLASGADLEKRYDGMTPLYMAAWRGGPGAVRALIASGADVNAKNDWGSTPLHAAAINRQNPAWIVHMLINGGADYNALDQYGNSALHAAAGAADHLAIFVIRELRKTMKGQKYLKQRNRWDQAPYDKAVAVKRYRPDRSDNIAGLLKPSYYR